MSAVLERPTGPLAVAAAHTAVDGLLAGDLTRLPEDQLLELVRDTERLRRRLAAVGHAQVLEIERRGLPAAQQIRTLGQFLRGLLRLDPGEAAGRVRAAEAAGARRALTGELLAPIYPAVAAAQADGEISERHAHVVVDTIEKLPDEVQAEHGSRIETELVGYCAQFEPGQVAKLGIRIAAYYDPDGRLKDVDYRAQHRDLTVRQRADGSCSVMGEGTAELAEFLLLTLDAFGKPTPEVDGLKDPRTAGQRRHDALLQALKLNVRARALPSVAGVTATVVLTMSAEDFERRRGLARTAHGALIPVPEAMRMTAGEYRLMNVVIDRTKGITAYSSTARLHSELQRLARAAVDGGCTFPNCPAPPGWCEMDHVIDHADGGPTRVDLAVLACHPHNEAKKRGWTSNLINGRGAWIPPAWVDRDRRPRFNHLHDTHPPDPGPLDTGRPDADPLRTHPPDTGPDSPVTPVG
jgi:Domain of unknown function (DUF222)